MVLIYPENANVAIATLASQIALQLSGDYEGANLDHNTLLKKTIATAAIENKQTGSPLLVGMAYGELTVTQIKTALEFRYRPSTGSLGSSIEQQAIVRSIVWDSLMVFTAEDTSKRVSFSHAGGKGLPFREDAGWQWFIYNLGNTDQSTGARMNIQCVHYGVAL